MKNDAKCGHIKRDGQACKLSAGYDTDHPGTGKCCHHEYPNPYSIRHESKKLPEGFCVCRSRYEKNALKRLDSDLNVMRYKYEPYSIHYNYNGIAIEDNYKPDVWVEYMDGRKTLIEIKTRAEMSIPRNEDTYEKNYAKFRAADLFAKQREIGFIIWVYYKWEIEVWSFNDFCQKAGRLGTRICIKVIDS